MRNTIIQTIFFCIANLAFCSSSTQGSKKETPPNILFILTDDLGAGDLACTGHPYAKSPNIDKLAENGIRFNRTYMAASWCAPSRYALMRGQFPAREFYASLNLKPDQPTITSILKNAGYNTAHFGKWHMNEGGKFSNSPGDFGIDKHFTTASNGPGWTKEQTSDRYFRATSTDKYVDMAIDFINANNPEASGKPFYINLWVSPTHSYIDPTPGQLEKYKGLKVKYEDFKNPLQQEFLKFVAQHGDIDKAMQAYCADVTTLDSALGRLFKFLNDKGIDKNTLIVFASDNGPGPLTGQLADGSVIERYKEMPTLLNSVGSAGDFRDRKLSLHDGGTHVPFIVSWPGKVPKGKVDNESVICGVDWLPTIASICGAKLPESNYDGIDAKLAFMGQPIKRNKPIFWHENYNSSAILHHGWKGIIDDNGMFYLFNTEKDPSESNNLKDTNLEKAQEIKTMLNEFLTTVPSMKENKENMSKIVY